MMTNNDDNDAQVGMSMMENPNLMDAANFGGPQSPIGEQIMVMTMTMIKKRRRNFLRIILQMQMIFLK